MIIISAAVALIDQYFKGIISKTIPEGSYRPIRKDWLYIANIKNEGMAYGILSKKRKLILGISGISSVFLGILISHSRKEKRRSIYKLGLALIAGGGMSNVYDRIVKGQVTDYIYIKSKKAPVFNIADVAIMIGFLLSLISDLSKGRK